MSAANPQAASRFPDCASLHPADSPQPKNVSNSSFTFSATMMPATIHATAATGTGDRELAHLAPVGDEPHQRDHRERQLHRQHDLAEHQQLAVPRSP